MKKWYLIKLENIIQDLLALGRMRTGVLQFTGEESKRLYDIIEQVNKVLGEVERDIKQEENQ